MSLFLLDTNIASHIIRQDDPRILEFAYDLPAASLVISAVTKGELIFELAKIQVHPKLAKLMREFLQTVTVLPWTDETAETYGTLKATCRARGIGLSALDMMIAAHAVSLGATLVSRYKAFGHIGDGLKVVDWV